VSERTVAVGAPSTPGCGKLPVVELSSKRVVVTGGARRVGRAIVESLAEAGGRPIIHCHQSRAAALDLARATGGDVLQADLSRPGGAERLVAEVLALGGELAVWVNSAALLERAPFLASTEELWRRTLELVLLAPMTCSRLIAPHLISGGLIVNILDVAAHQPWSGYAHHCAAKAALHMLTRCLAVELGPRVRVCGVTPGVMGLPEEGPSPWDSLVRRAPLSRAGHPRDVGRAVRYLVDADYVTGSVIAVDGGLTARGLGDSVNH
jgi:pteridine reductase